MRKGDGTPVDGRNNRILYRIPARLTAAREAAGMSKNALANAMGSDVSALSKIESGERIPSTQTLANAGDAMGFLMKCFFEEEETEFSQTDLLIALLPCFRPRPGLPACFVNPRRPAGDFLPAGVVANDKARFVAADNGKRLFFCYAVIVPKDRPAVLRKKSYETEKQQCRENISPYP